MEGRMLSLKWNDHNHTFFEMLSTVRRKESYSDVTLVSDGRFYPAHKLVLSTCSEFFSDIFSRIDCKKPMVIVGNVSQKELEALLDYMYLGEVNVLQSELGNLMKAAEILRIKGLAESPSKDTSTPSRDYNSGTKRKRLEETSDPPVKRSSPGIPDRIDPRDLASSVASTDPLSFWSPSKETSVGHQEKGTGQDNQKSSEKLESPEVKVEETVIKEEPGSYYSGKDETENFNYSEADFTGSSSPWGIPSTTQSHSSESQLPWSMQGEPPQGIRVPKKWRKLGNEEHARLLILAKENPKASSEKLRQILQIEYNIDVSSRTIRRALIGAGVRPAKLPTKFNKFFVQYGQGNNQTLQNAGNNYTSTNEDSQGDAFWNESSNT